MVYKVKLVLLYPLAGSTPTHLFPTSEIGFLWKYVPSCPTVQYSQGPSLCSPFFPCSLNFFHRITSFPFPQSCPLWTHCPKTTMWTARGDSSPVLGPLYLSRVAPGVRRKARRKRKKKQWFGSYQWPAPEEERGNADKYVTLQKHTS